MTIEEFIESKKHIHGVLIPLIQEFTVESTIAVYSLNPIHPLHTASQQVKVILRSKGYTRLYVLYLFSRVGDFTEFYDLPIEELVSPKYNTYIDSIIPDVSKVFFNYGHLANQRIEQLVENRVKEVKEKILEIKENTEFFYFGDLTESGHPKELEQLEANDRENRFT